MDVVGWSQEKKIVLAIAGVSAILLTGILGLILGNAADESGQVPTAKETYVESRDIAQVAVDQSVKAQGRRDGKEEGASWGERVGTRAGESDGRVLVQQVLTARAQAAAATAQAELSAVLIPPPAPPVAAPVVPGQ